MENAYLEIWVKVGIHVASNMFQKLNQAFFEIFSTF